MSKVKNICVKSKKYLCDNIDLKSVKKIIAYNANFDYNVLLSEAYRNDCTDLIKSLQEKEIICAMKFAKKELNLSRHMKLIDLYNELNNSNDKQDHRALKDIEMTANCFFKLLKYEIE